MAQAGKTRKFTALSSKLHRRRVRAGLRTLALQRDVWKILKRRGAGLQPMAETLKRLGTPLFPLTRRGTALATTAVLAALAVTFALLKPLAMNEGGPDGPQAPPASASTAEPGSRDAAETMLLQSIEAAEQSQDWGSASLQAMKLGELHLEKGDEAGASSAFKRVVELAERRGPVRLLETFAALGELYQARHNQEQAEKMFLRQLELAERANVATHRVLALGRLAAFRNAQGDLDAAEFLSKTELEVSRTLSDKRGMSHACATLASVYKKRGDTTTACAWADRSCALAEPTAEAGDNAGCAVSAELGLGCPTFSSIQRPNAAATDGGEAGKWLAEGKKQGAAGDTAGAMASFKNALTLSSTADDKSTAAAAASELGTIHQAQRHHRKAQELFNRAIELDRAGQREEDLVRDYGRLGLSYVDDGQLDRAQAAYEMALEISRKLRSDEGEADSLGGLGEVCFNRGELDCAAEMFKKAMALQKAPAAAPALAMNYSNLATVYLKKRDRTAACAYWKKSRELLRKAAMKPQLERVERMLRQTCASQGPLDRTIIEKLFDFLDGR